MIRSTPTWPTRWQPSSTANPLGPETVQRFFPGHLSYRLCPIARVSLFDSHSAAVYLTEKTDVAFRPFGLDLFDRLSKTCRAVRDKLDREKRLLGSSTLQALDLPEGTAAAKLVADLSSLTDPEEEKTLATLSEAEKERLKLLEKQLVDLQANEPSKTARELTLRAGRLRPLVKHLNELEADIEALETWVKTIKKRRSH